ncbi:MAG: response regulator [Planctomycetota bacterium]
MDKRFSVLLAEDDTALRRCLVEVLAANGWSVHPVGTGPEAVEIARRVPVDFSLLDMHLPGMTGIDVYRAIAREKGPLPWILMSGQATPEETSVAFALGVHTFLRKPLDLTGLRLCLAELIQRNFGGRGPAPSS